MMRVFRMKRKHLQVYLILGLVAVIGVIIYSNHKSKKIDYRPQAKKHLQVWKPVKPASCPDDADYSVKATTVSVVVAAHINQQSVITQTVNSIIVHTHPNLLEEIIISTDENIKNDHFDALLHEFKHYGKLIRIVKSTSTNAMKTKMLAGHTARASVVLFVEDTVVLSQGYLLPLTKVLEENPRCIVVPAFDTLTEATLLVKKNDLHMKWVFDWRFSVHPYEIPFNQISSPEKETELIATPAITPKAFAMRKSYLEELSKQKHKLEFSSSLELSFASWMCGDGAYIVPCSRAAFTNIHAPVNEGDHAQHWLVAERYLTERYRQVFQSVNGTKPLLDQQVLQIEKGFQKKCPKNFDWYMSEVVKDSVFTPTSETLAFGYFISPSTDQCFRNTASQLFLALPCNSVIPSASHMVEYTKRGQLRMSGGNCIKPSVKNYMITDRCDTDDPKMLWQTNKLHQFKQDGNHCLSHTTDPYPEENNRQVLMFALCKDDENHSDMRWQAWTSFTWLNNSKIIT